MAIGELMNGFSSWIYYQETYSIRFVLNFFILFISVFVPHSPVNVIVLSSIKIDRIILNFFFFALTRTPLFVHMSMFEAYA